MQGNFNSFTCSECGKVFKMEDDLRWHFESHLDGRFARSALRKQESSNICSSAINPYNAEEPSTDVTNNAFLGSNWREAAKERLQLENHIGIDARDKPFSCSTCRKSFPYKCQLKKHSVVHTDEKPFTCYQCGKAYKRKNDLRRHLERHLDGRFARSELRKQISTNRCSSAIQSYNAEGPSTDVTNHTFLGSNCREAAKEMFHLENHIGIDARDKPFSCSTCSKSFPYKCQLKNHSVVHTDEKPFTCYQCGKAYKRKEHLRRHFERHHWIHSVKCDFARKKGEKTFNYRVDAKNTLNANSEIERFPIEAGKDAFEQTYNYSTCAGDKQPCIKSCYMDFQNKQELVSLVRTYSESDSYQRSIFAPENSRQLEGHKFADLANNYFGDSTWSKQITENELVTHINIGREGKFPKNFDSFNTHPDDIASHQPNGNDATQYLVICSYCGEEFQRHGDLQRYLRVHRSKF